ncbi:MAG: DUF4397 domain-containing protein [Myxococcota bacterium]
MRLRTNSELLTLLVALSITACGDDITSADTDSDDSTSTSDGSTDPDTTATPTSVTESASTTTTTTVDTESDSDDTESDSDSDSDDTESDSDSDSDDTESDSDSDSDSDDSTSTGEPEDTTEVRVLHLSPDAGNVDVYVNGGEDPAVVDLPFLDGTMYIALPPDTYTFDVAPTGTSLGDSVLTVEDLELAVDTRYTAVAYDFAANIAALALVDDEADIDGGETRLQISHTGAGVPEVDIYDFGSGSAIVEDLDFGETQTLDVPTGEYRLGVDIDNDAIADLLYVVPELPGGINVNVFAVFDGMSAPFLLAQLPDGDTVRIDRTAFPGIRVAHLAPEAPNVDVYFNGSEVPFLTNVPFTGGSAYFSLDPGVFSFDIAPAGTSLADSVLSLEDLTFDPGTNYTAAAIGVDPLEGLALVDDVEGLAETDTRLQIVHAGTQVPTVNIINAADDSELVADLAFGTASTIDVPTGAYTIGADIDDDGVSDLLFAVPELGGGVQANVYATNDAAGDVFLLAHLPDGTIVRIDPLQTGIRVMHLSPDAPPVDVYANGGADPVVEGLAFTEGTAYLNVPAGSYDFVVTAEGGDPVAAPVLTINDLEIEQGVLYTAAAIDELASITALPLVDDVVGIPVGNTRFQIVHAGAGVGEVDIINLADDSQLISDIVLGDSAVLDLPSAPYGIGIDVDDDGAADLSFNVPELGPNVFVNVYAANNDDGDVFLLAHLPDGSVVQLDPFVINACGVDIESELDAGDPTYNRSFDVGAACELSGTGTNTFYEVHTFEAVAGEDVTASTCGQADFDTTLTIYQAADGSPNPFDPADPCANTIAYNDDAAGCAGNTSETTATGLVAGQYQVVVTSFFNGTTGDYTLSTTCE